MMEATIAQELIEEFYVSELEDSPSGVACSFFALDKKWGVKTYYSEDKRNECYDRQSEAAEFGFGPAVGETFEVYIPDEDAWIYCYVTERAELLVSDEVIKAQNRYKKVGDNYYEYQDLCRPFRIKWEDKIDILADEMEEALGWRNYDRHIFNYGLINGKLVCIDFGND